MEIATASGSIRSRFASGTEWLAWRSDSERGRQEIAAARESECLALKSALVAGGHDPQPERMAWTYGIETVYKVSLKDAMTGATYRAEIYGFFGTTMPATEAERAAHFTRQINAAILTARKAQPVRRSESEI
jgi:hypothetical protein